MAMVLKFWEPQDWRNYQTGALVLGVSGGKLSDRRQHEATLSIEVVSETKRGTTRAYRADVLLPQPKARDDIKKQGYSAVRIRLRDITNNRVRLSDNLQSVREIKIVFDPKTLPPDLRKGSLNITEICLEKMPRNDRVVVHCNHPADKPRTSQVKFGVFSEAEDVQSQAIVQAKCKRDIRDVGPMQFLQLVFVLKKKDAFLGWWLRPVNPTSGVSPDDWSEAENGSLILRGRLERGGVDMKMFKVEIKTPDEVYPGYVRITQDHLDQIEKRGYADFVVPLRPIVGSSNALKQVVEFVIVFEQNRLGTSSGAFLLESVRLNRSFPPN